SRHAPRRHGPQGAGFIRACDPVHASATAVWRSSARISLWAVEFRHAVTHNLVHQQRAQGGLMIELEIQALSERREGLLIEVGRIAVANGFTLQRQRLVQDPHGILLTIVVRGPPRKKRALEAALEAYDRITSFDVAPFVESEQRPHFAASRAPLLDYVPAPLPEPVAAVAVVETAKSAATPAAATVAFDEIEPARLTVAPSPAPLAASPPAPATRPEPEFEFILPEPTRAPPAAPPVAEAPFVEIVPLEPDQAAVDKVLSKLATEYPQIMPR